MITLSKEDLNTSNNSLQVQSVAAFLLKYMSLFFLTIMTFKNKWKVKMKQSTYLATLNLNVRTYNRHIYLLLCLD